MEHISDKHMDDEISLSEVFKFLWSAKTKIIVSITILVLAYMALMATRYLLISEATYSQEIYFKFPGVEESKLPNGDVFRINDILSPSVLEEVISNLGIQEELTLSELSNSINIYPFSASRGFIIDKYNAILKDKAADANSKREAQALMESELKTTSMRAAKLMMVTSQSFSEEKAKQILTEISKTWAKHAVEIQGAGHLDLEILSNNVINQSRTAGDSIEEFKMSWYILDTLKRQVRDALDAQTISLVRDTDTDYTLQDAVHLLNDIEHRLIISPRHWSNDSKSSPKLNVALYSPALFDESIIEGLDYLIAIDLVTQRISLVKDNVNILLQHGAANLAVDTKTNLALEDIKKLAEDLEEYELQNIQAPLLQLGISKNPDRVEMYYTFRVNKLERELKQIQSMISTLEEAEVRYLSGNTKRSNSNNQSQNTSAATTMMPQFGDAFIDKIISLSQKSDDVGFRQDLNSQAIGLSKRAVLIASEISQLREYLVLFNASTIESTSEKNKQTKEKFEAETSALILNALNKTQLYAEATNNIARAIRFSETIFNIISESALKPSNSEYYLESRSPKSQLSLQTINSELSGIAILVSNIFEKSSVQFLGKQDYLFSYGGEASKLAVPLTTKRDLLVLVLLVFLGGFIGLVWQLIRKFSTSPKLAEL
jgi:capsular polysaccharide biosynthesis protein